MHLGNVASNQTYGDALQDQYKAMDRCRKMTHGVNACLLALHVVLVAVWSHVVRV
jgi:hypothetical protein